jgi:hypothetical protein
MSDRLFPFVVVLAFIAVFIAGVFLGALAPGLVWFFLGAL